MNRRFDQYPRLRRGILIAGIIGASALAAACSGRSGDAAPPASTAASAPAATQPEATPSQDTKAEALHTAETYLQQTSIDSAKKIIEDASSPTRVCERYDTASIGNKAQEQAKGLVGTSFQEIFINYDTEGHSVTVNSGNKDHWMSLHFSVRPKFNDMDAIIAYGVRPTTSDFLHLFAGDNVTLESATAGSENYTHTTRRQPDGTFDYSNSGPHYNTQPFHVDAANLDILYREARRLDAATAALSAGLQGAGA